MVPLPPTSLCAWCKLGSAVDFRRNGDTHRPRKRKRNISKLIFWRKEPASPRVKQYVIGKGRREARVQFADLREIEEIWA